MDCADQQVRQKTKSPGVQDGLQFHILCIFALQIQFAQITPTYTLIKEMETITVDVLVCGGGMAGMACAAFAAEAGAKVLVAEKQSQIGGSSNYSAGML